MNRRHLIKTVISAAAATAVPSLPSGPPAFIPETIWEDIGGGAMTAPMVWHKTLDGVEWLWKPNPHDGGQWCKKEAHVISGSVIYHA